MFILQPKSDLARSRALLSVACLPGFAWLAAEMARESWAPKHLEAPKPSCKSIIIEFASLPAAPLLPFPLQVPQSSGGTQDCGKPDFEAGDFMYLFCKDALEKRSFKAFFVSGPE